ncbi:hypothetical protein PV04_04049 [Phialophora macrospora]|uniref:Uncharacterized protein n=1 Tax=Phialophora macrospora TaxID=1851006 RepID=A0A0D2CSE8_9EURO|nr:hypothetical protein PV04_04049 [Phialophora macrospora]
MASKEAQANNKSDLITKDAMYLFELMRDSPQPILLYITPYAEKTGTKANTIVKRLGEIKKRNGLNIITTTSPPSDVKSHTTPKPRASNPRVEIKRERKPNVAKISSPDSNNRGDVKVEESNTHAPGSPPVLGLPSPAASSPATPPSRWTTGANFSPAIAPGMVPGIAMSTPPMPLFMPQKRTFSEVNANANADADNHYVKHEDNNAVKKVKTEAWDMGF